MRRLLCLLLTLALISGCSSNSNALERMISVREKLLGSAGCQFDIQINVDYGEKLYSFSMQCSTDKVGNLTFMLLSPETIEGISGCISDVNGELTFDDNVLVFETLMEGVVTPVAAPWIFIRSLRGGYIKSAGKHPEGSSVQIDDTYRGYDLELDILLDNSDVPISAEILWSGSRVITMYVENFKYL